MLPFSASFDKVKEESCGNHVTPITGHQHSRRTHSQLVQLSEHKRQADKQSSLQQLNARKRLDRLITALDMHKKLVLTLSQHDVPRLKQLIAPHSGRILLQVFNCMQMDAGFQKEQIGTLFVWVGPMIGPQMGGEGRGVHPRNYKCLSCVFFSLLGRDEF